jgi:hypothetical protein
MTSPHRLASAGRSAARHHAREADSRRNSATCRPSRSGLDDGRSGGPRRRAPPSGGRRSTTRRKLVGE